MKKLLLVAALAAASVVAAPALGEAKARKAIDNRAECFPWSQRSAQGDRLICPSFFFRPRSTEIVLVKKKHHHHHHKPHFKPPTSQKLASVKFKHKHKHKFKKVSRGTKMSAGASYVISGTFCSAASLWVNAAIVNAHQRRPLLPSEAHEVVADCFVPIVGGLVVRHMHRANPHWDRMIIQQSLNLARRD